MLKQKIGEFLSLRWARMKYLQTLKEKLTHEMGTYWVIPEVATVSSLCDEAIYVC